MNKFRVLLALSFTFPLFVLVFDPSMHVKTIIVPLSKPPTDRGFQPVPFDPMLVPAIKINHPSTPSEVPLDSKDSKPEAMVFNRTVALRDSWAKKQKKGG